jgi:hypothetical protein
MQTAGDEDARFPGLGPLESVYGRRQVQQLQRHLDTLRQREREGAHGNRELFLSDIFVAQLLAFHLPIVRSLRTLDALSTTNTAQQLLSVDRIARSTLSDANTMVEPRLLEPIIADLIQRVDARHLPSELETLTRRLVAVDGTFLRIVGELLWALRQRVDCRGRGGATVRKTISKPRLDVQFDVASGVPRFAILSGHECSESNAARLHIEAGKIYVADKAYFSFKLLNDWLEGSADFVVALNSQIRFAPQEALDLPASSRPPSKGGRRDRPAPSDSDLADPRADNILSDRLGHLPGCDHSDPPRQRLREVIVQRDDGQPLRLLTSLTHPAITAEMIGEMYRRRWSIELFFRWLKSIARFRHALSHSPAGLTVALYVALIGTLLTTLATGRRPSKYAFAVLGFVAAGMAEWKDMLPTLERFEREREQARARYARRRQTK